MLEPFTLTKHLSDGLKDPNLPVRMEIEKRRPDSQRDHIIGVIGLLLICAILLYCRLKGWDLPL